MINAVHPYRSSRTVSGGGGVETLLPDDLAQGVELGVAAASTSALVLVTMTAEIARPPLQAIKGDQLSPCNYSNAFTVTFTLISTGSVRRTFVPSATAQTLSCPLIKRLSM